ncbi:phosphoglycerate mutase family protein [Pseudomonas sp. IT-P253]|uniref:phosphoglycerate mutase family protein n=1 Tax=Pseudomonas sp. IT-P253 TaxID=3026455 RepID=UPI0039E1061F
MRNFLHIYGGPAMKRVRLIRHAESAANAGLATTAPDSIPLTEKGQLQARAFAESITSAPDLIISSPFERAIATALPATERFPHFHSKIPSHSLWRFSTLTATPPSICTSLAI